MVRDVTGSLRVRGFGDPLGVRVTASVPFAPPLDVGAAVVADAHGVRLGGRDLDRVEALFGPDVRAAAAAAGAAGHLEVADGQVGWRAWFPLPGEADTAAEAVGHALRVHAALEAARGAVGPRAGLEAAAAAFAAAPRPQGLVASGAPVGVLGAVAGVPLAVWATPRGLEVRIGLPTPLPGAPQVVREERFGWADRLGATLAGRGEVTVGDAAFDARFAVRSLRPEALAEVLTPEVRAAMLALDAHLAVALGAAAVTASGPLDPTVVGEVVARAAALAETLSRAR